MIRLSISMRQALGKLTVPVLIALAVGMVLLGRMDVGLPLRARMAVADRLVPIYGLVAAPLIGVRQALSDTMHLFSLRAENARLRADNEELRRWQAVAQALDAENATLKANLHWLPDPAPSFVTARVVADAGGIYARSVLLSTAGTTGVVQRGQVALDASGLVGRVTDIGARSARVLLITDINSRLPVMLENSRARAMLVGNNAARPRLMYWPDGMQPAEGERVVTSAEAGDFPAGLPVGLVHLAGNVVEVRPFAQLDRLDVVRLFDYGLASLLPPDAAARPDRKR